MRPGYGRSVQRNLTPRTTACVVAGSLRLRGTVEAWVMLQHANVLLNPFCQRLDRRYGAPSALLQNRFVSALFLSPKSRGACPGLASRPLAEVSMLRKGEHWVIAGVLVMYWSREAQGTRRTGDRRRRRLHNIFVIHI